MMNLEKCLPLLTEAKTASFDPTLLSAGIGLRGHASFWCWCLWTRIYIHTCTLDVSGWYFSLKPGTPGDRTTDLPHLPSCTFCLFISAARSNDALLSPFSQQACGYEVYDYSESALWFLKSSACRPASWMFVLLISSIFLSSWYVWWNACFNMFTTGFLLSLETQITQIQQAVHALEVPLTQWMYS